MYPRRNFQVPKSRNMNMYNAFKSDYLIQRLRGLQSIRVELPHMRASSSSLKTIVETN
jgi:hypothetical protein